VVCTVYVVVRRAGDGSRRAEESAHRQRDGSEGRIEKREASARATLDLRRRRHDQTDVWGGTPEMVDPDQERTRSESAMLCEPCTLT
jgi:hypothetical protein